MRSTGAAAWRLPSPMNDREGLEFISRWIDLGLLNRDFTGSMAVRTPKAAHQNGNRHGDEIDNHVDDKLNRLSEPSSLKEAPVPHEVKAPSHPEHPKG